MSVVPEVLPNTSPDVVLTRSNSCDESREKHEPPGGHERHLQENIAKIANQHEQKAEEHHAPCLSQPVTDATEHRRRRRLSEAVGGDDVRKKCLSSALVDLNRAGISRKAKLFAHFSRSLGISAGMPLRIRGGAVFLYHVKTRTFRKL